MGSRVEDILENMLGDTHELEPPLSRVEELLIELLDKTTDGHTGFVILAEGQYDPVTKVPTVSNPKENIFYLTPGEDLSGGFYNEYVYVNDSWELFGQSRAVPAIVG